MTIAGNVGPFGDTTLTKVFVGGLAWETPKDVMQQHFDKYGQILEAVIISDKVTGRSKGYGFVTFKEAEAAKRACEDATPIINGRRANCNLASLGARRNRSANSTPPQQAPTAVGPRSTSTAPTTNHVQTWYYPAGSPASALYHQQQHHPVPYYGYTPTYIATDISYNHAKVNYTSGSYMNMNMNMNGHYSHHQVYPGQAYVGGGGNTLVPMYPLYHFHNQSQTMGLPAHHVFPTTATAAGHIATVPTVISKPPPIAVAPNTVCLAVE